MLYRSNRALEAVRTPWVAFLDDDDQFLPHHLQRLSQALTETQADVVYPLPRVLDSRGHLIQRQWPWGGPEEFDPELLRRQSSDERCDGKECVSTRQSR